MNKFSPDYLQTNHQDETSMLWSFITAFFDLPELRSQAADILSQFASNIIKRPDGTTLVKTTDTFSEPDEG